jgi:5-methylcytosine-specific restriction endonuclease McrA
MNTALVINAIFEDVLSEILSAQEKAPSKPHFLQPYSQDRITLLAKEPPSELSPRTLYLSLTASLHEISYQAKIVGWQDKRKIGSAELEALNKEIAQFQPNEKEMIYVTGEGGRQYVNLISIIELKRLRDPISVSCFVKVNDGLPLKKKKRPGGWSYVGEQPQWLGASSTSLLDDVTKELEIRVRESLESTSAQRQARLAVAPHKPQEIQVLSRAYRRNSDVIIEVLLRANGQCEQCGSPAPFLRASNESPYLEVHHKVPLALGGDDTVANATALCPNCHRQNHFGKAISQGTWPDPILAQG